MGVSASAAVAARSKRLRSDFILEVADSGGETTVGSHVRVAEQTETQLEIERFGERLLLKDASADHLTDDRHQHFVLACGENFNLCDLRFLVKLLGTNSTASRVRWSWAFCRAGLRNICRSKSG